VSSAPHRVGILVFDNMKLLDIAGPADVFTQANQLGSNYELSMVSASGADVRTSMGLRIPVDYAASAAGQFQTVLVAGGEAFPAGEVTESLATAAFDLSQSASRTASICTGAFVLAAASLLDGKRATTHWLHALELAQRYPAIQVEPDAIYIKDGSTYSSAGVTAGIDLALALLEEDAGVDTARTVARALVVYLRREGGQSQFAGTAPAPIPRDSLLRSVVETVTGNPAAEYSVTRLAEIARVSPRHLSRLFRDELGTTPNKYVELIRFDRAKGLLDSGSSVTEAAQGSGFGSSESLRRAFIAHMAIPPSTYRGRFSSTLAAPPHQSALR
jgi:transcriptional regulator GlxA family with amidase domain